MANTYLNIIRGEDIEMPDSKFAESYVSFEKFKSDFFRDRDIVIKSECKLSRESYTTAFDFEYNGVLFHCVYLNIKNSGMNQNERDKIIKRMQIGANFTYYDDSVPQFVIGSYNTYDKVLYFVVELKDYIKNKMDLGQKDYSSFWLDYGHIWSTYEKGISKYVDDKNNRVVIGIDNLKINDLEDEQLINSIFLNNGYYDAEYKKIREKEIKEPVIFEENDNTTYNAGLKLKRNPELKNIAFKKTNYCCELCGTNSTFKNKNGDEYFEGHHLIMYNLTSQKKYKYSLDNVENIVCLCPMCHKKIHYSDSETITSCVKELFKKHSNLFDIYEIENVESILKEYKCYEGDDDNE